MHRTHRTSDPKIDRFRASIPGLTQRDATWLARVADEVTAAAGTVLGARRFAHVVLDGVDAGTVVAPDGRPHVLRDAARVLVLRAADAGMLRARLASEGAATVRPATAAAPAVVARA